MHSNVKTFAPVGPARPAALPVITAAFIPTDIIDVIQKVTVIVVQVVRGYSTDVLRPRLATKKA